MVAPMEPSTVSVMPTSKAFPDTADTDDIWTDEEVVFDAIVPEGYDACDVGVLLRGLIFLT